MGGMDEALDLYVDGRLDEARASVTAHLNAHPDDVDARALLAQMDGTAAPPVDPPEEAREPTQTLVASRRMPIGAAILAGIIALYGAALVVAALFDGHLPRAERIFVGILGVALVTLAIGLIMRRDGAYLVTTLFLVLNLVGSLISFNPVLIIVAAALLGYMLHVGPAFGKRMATPALHEETRRAP